MPTERRLVHREHAVTDGRDLTEARSLEQHTVVVHHTLDRLSHEIQFAFGVPPQVQGRNINSERMASSNRLNEQAITHFRATARRFKAQLDLIFSVIGGAAYGDKADAFALDQVAHLLKTDRAISLFALAYGLKRSDFDRSKIEQILVPPQKSKNRRGEAVGRAEAKPKQCLSRPPTWSMRGSTGS